MRFKGNIKQGKLTISDSRYKDYLITLDGDISVAIEKWKTDRTTSQNRLLWKYYEIIADETGDNIEDLHEFLKRKLLPPRFIKVMNKDIKLPASTTKLSTVEFKEYLEKINALTGVPIPDKNLL